MNGWISVKDRLPIFGEEVLACTSDGSIYFAARTRWGDKCGWEDLDSASELEHVANWMPLPEPPEDV